MLSDGELLRQYVDDGSEAAFTTLVHRHVDGVYRAALRRVGGNAHAADDVAQRVFTALARKASTLKRHQSLAGWLYTATRFAAAELVRSEQRRRRHEEEAHAMRETNVPSTIAVDQLDPCLDDVLENLSPTDREAVLLHFLEQRSFVDIATLLASNPDAVRMRVNRALERMRVELQRRGVTSTTAALGMAFAAESLRAAPPALADTIARQALAHAGVTVAAHVAGPVKMTTWIAGTTTVVIIGTLVFVARPWFATPDDAATPPSGRRIANVASVAAATDATVVPSAASTPRTPSDAVQSAVSPTTGISQFGALSTEEKNILMKLWMEQHDAPQLPGHRWALHVGGRAPNHDGVKPLIDHHWVRYNANGGLLLTNAGYEFCRRHLAEIETYARQTDDAAR